MHSVVRVHESQPAGCQVLSVLIGLVVFETANDHPCELGVITGTGWFAALARCDGGHETVILVGQRRAAHADADLSPFRRQKVSLNFRLSSWHAVNCSEIER
jgi:hypothetical protein